MSEHTQVFIVTRGDIVIDFIYLSRDAALTRVEEISKWAYRVGLSEYEVDSESSSCRLLKRTTFPKNWRRSDSDEW